MAELIEQLTEKIYREGVEKAKEKAKGIIAQAEEERDNIINRGKAESEKLLRETKHNARELRQSTETDIRMAAQKALATVRQRIEKVITASLAGSAADEVAGDKNFLKKIIEKIIERWDETSYSNESLVIKLAPADTKAMEAYFVKGAVENLKEKLIFNSDAKIKAGFTIEPLNGKFKVGFTDEDFKEFFQFFLREKIKQFLFGR